MRNSRPQILEKLFDETQNHGVLQQIQQHAMVLNKLNKAMHSILSAPLHSWVRVANYRQGILRVEVASANWMMRLRYEQSTLLSALRAQILPSLAAIDISINPSLAAKKWPSEQENDKQQTHVPRSPDRQLSQESAAALRIVAERSPEKLKQTLERLASLAGESGTSKTRRDKGQGNASG